MRRVRIEELMDDPAVSEKELAHALRSLNFTNRVLGADRGQKKAISKLNLGKTPKTGLVDIACGGGGFLNSFAAGQTVAVGKFLGIDRSLNGLMAAQSNGGGNVFWICADALKLPLSTGSVEVVTSSLFLHHLDEPDVEIALREFGRVAGRAVVVLDLTRSWLAWVMTWVVTRIVSRSKIFHVDGPRSVRASFRRAELKEIAERAGLKGATVRRCFPFRMRLTWVKTSGAGGHGQAI